MFVFSHQSYHTSLNLQNMTHRVVLKIFTLWKFATVIQRIPLKSNPVTYSWTVEYRIRKKVYSLVGKREDE